jgi:hypothetical protein
VEDISDKDLAPFTGRGLPTRYVQRKLKGNAKNMEKLAWLLEANEASEGDLYVTVWAILAKLFDKYSKGQPTTGREAQFLHHILRAKADKPAMVTRIMVDSQLKELSESEEKEMNQVTADTVHNISAMASGHLSQAQAIQAALKATAFISTLQRRHTTRIREGFTDWIRKNLTENVGALHKWTKGAEDPSARADVLFDPVSRTLDTNPNNVLEARTSEWGKIWHCDDAEAKTRTIMAIEEARMKALAATDETISPVTGSDIREAAKSFPSKTSIGLDTWGFTEIAQAEDSDLDKLAHIITSMQREIAPPRQCLGQLLTLLGKKGGGHRTVCTMPTLIRITTRLDALNDRQWNMNHSHEDDSAKPETSCLWAAEERLVEQEVLFLSGVHIVMVLWDVAKFYDSLQYDDLAQSCEEQEYGYKRSALTFVVHASPRVLKIKQALGRMLSSVGRSILAGCQRAQP